MDISQDGSVFGYWNGQGVKMLKSLLGKKSLVVAAAPWGKGPVEITFGITGIDAVVKGVRTACGW